MAWNVVAAFVINKLFGYQTANKMRENSIALASRRAIYPLGGSRVDALPRAAAASPVHNYIDIELDGTLLSGFTVRARVECRTTNAGTTVTPSVYNVTDAGSAGATGAAACAATNEDYSGTDQKQTLVFTPAVGVKKYRLLGTPSNADNDVFVIGYFEIFADA